MPNASMRLSVPETFSSPLTKSSYLRLGSYSDEEANLVTGLTATVNDGPAVTREHESDNAGILAFTNKDFQTNVEGAALLKIGCGQTMEVTNGNVQHKVPKGIYEISAENGVSITAGSAVTSADIILTASNRVKLVNKGDKVETTTGNTEKRIMGNAEEFFDGTKLTCMRGAATQLTMARKVSIFFGEAFTYKISRSCSFNLSDTQSVTVGNNLNVVRGHDVKQVIGKSTKCVFGPDFKSADSSQTILKTSSFKYVPVEDLKVVGRDSKICKTSMSVTEKDVRQGKLSTAQHELVIRAAETMSRTGKREVIQKDQTIFL
ncbi:hypothetical protein [Bradyrhizobium sp. CCGUVB23]|uniref:hypothetical protein n=1 Tax=Bradyrhizobium sp. CCGUVB23 TaxID=2949630 RepID=UPI0020B2A785|nr:hypothetical protein [Bradyrhizobium sp. CCGUVB23]MCP3460560.1 hypothetical protein [Bradyrhizobium sp. CCGUVB23]